jgi:uncharacterized protein YkwD
MRVITKNRYNKTGGTAMKKLAGAIMIVCYCSIVFSCESLEADWETAGETEQAGTSTVSEAGLPATATTSSAPGGTTPPVLNQTRTSTDPNWDLAALDTAKDASYLSPIEKSVILELNKVRSDPRKYVRLYIRPELQYYSGRYYRRPGQARILTYEGVKAVEECITALSDMASAPPLTPELGLSLGARDLAYEQERTGGTGHEGADGSTYFIRIRRYGGGYNSVAENLYYGAEQAREAVIQMLIDDGMPSRQQRINIMKADFSQAGVSFGSHPEYQTVCVAILADGYVSN